MCSCGFILNDTATTEIYTYDTLFPYTTLFRSYDARLHGPRRHPAGPGEDPLGRDRPGDAERPLKEVPHRFRPGSRDQRCRLRGLGCPAQRSEEHTSELQSLMRISYAVFCLKKQIHTQLSQLFELYTQSEQ